MPDPHRLLLDLRWDGDLPAGRVAPAVAVPFSGRPALAAAIERPTSGPEAIACA